MEEKKTVIFFGDSNTYGYDPRDVFGGRYPKNRIWTSLAAAALEARWNVVNEGMNGREIPSGQWELRHVDALLRNLREEDIFAVMLGTNDIFLTSDPDADRGGRENGTVPAISPSGGEASPDLAHCSSLRRRAAFRASDVRSICKRTRPHEPGIQTPGGEI